MAKEDILITVKTYPVISKTYTELVCTAGLRKDGSWIRLYPVQFRKLSEDKQYKKYDIIRVPVIKNTKDHRPESHRLESSEDIEIVGHLGTINNWQKRKDYLFKNKIYRSIKELISEHKKSGISLATFKPAKIIRNYAEYKDDDETWTQAEKNQFKDANASLFDNDDSVNLTNMPKIPYSFKIEFQDIDGYESDMTILDWEFFQLYNNLRKQQTRDEAKMGVLKQLDNFTDAKDLYFFLGTTHLYDKFAPNPFTIIGIFYPDKKGTYSPPLF